MKFSRGVDAYRDGERVMSFATTKEAATWLREHGWPKATRGRVYDAGSVWWYEGDEDAPRPDAE